MIKFISRLIGTFFNLIALGFVSIANILVDVRSDIFYILIGKPVAWICYTIALGFIALGSIFRKEGIC